MNKRYIETGVVNGIVYALFQGREMRCPLICVAENKQMAVKELHIKYDLYKQAQP